MQGASGKPANADRYAAQPLSELDPQQETWAEQAAPANVNRKVIKVKTKAQRDKDAEKVLTHSCTPLRGAPLGLSPCHRAMNCVMEMSGCLVYCLYMSLIGRV